MIRSKCEREGRRVTDSKPASDLLPPWSGLRNQLFKEILLILTFLNFHQKNEIAFNFTKEILLKMNRGPKQKI